MNKLLPHCFYQAVAIVLAAHLATGCSGDQQQPASARGSAGQSANGSLPPPEEKRHEAESPSEARSAGDATLTAKLDAAGIPTQYVAHFDRDKLVRIEETRQADQRRGSYDFFGARLVKYSGAAVATPATLELEFDLQGALKSAHANGGTAANSDIGAIRDRAQLLRSHALSQRSTRTHAAH